jgi:hypothetical protein
MNSLYLLIGGLCVLATVAVLGACALARDRGSAEHRPTVDEKLEQVWR